MKKFSQNFLAPIFLIFALPFFAALFNAACEMQQVHALDTTEEIQVFSISSQTVPVEGCRWGAKAFVLDSLNQQVQFGVTDKELKVVEFRAKGTGMISVFAWSGFGFPSQIGTVEVDNTNYKRFGLVYPPENILDYVRLEASNTSLEADKLWVRFCK